MKFPHRVLEGDEEQAVINDIMARIPTLNQAGTKDRWEKGWGEILETYKRTGNIADLRPQYIRPNQPVRLNGKFVMPEDPDIEAKWYEKFFAGIADKWLSGTHAIYEFGCGSCHNVAWLAEHFPKQTIIGADWSKASRGICHELQNRGYLNVYGATCDFFDPQAPTTTMPTTGILTVGALEQTGRNWRHFLEYLLAIKPAVCVHLEPIVEWYDIANPVDRTAIVAHRARGFWEGFPDELRRRVGMGEVEILHMERTGFGSLFIEGYSQIVWRPT